MEHIDDLMDDKKFLRQKLKDRLRAQKNKRQKKNIPQKKSDGVYETVKAIQKDRIHMKFPDLLAKYKDFSDEYLEIFRIASSRTLDDEEMQRLKKMILQKEMIERGDITLEEASSLTSEQLAKRYQPDLLK